MCSLRGGDKLSQTGRVHIRLLGKTNLYYIPFTINSDNPNAFAQEFQRRRIEQIADGSRQWSIAVLEFRAHVGELIFILYSGDALVHAQALILLLNVFVGQAKIERKVQLRANTLW